MATATDIDSPTIIMSVTINPRIMPNRFMNRLDMIRREVMKEVDPRASQHSLAPSDDHDDLLGEFLEYLLILNGRTDLHEELQAGGVQFIGLTNQLEMGLLHGARLVLAFEPIDGLDRLTITLEGTSFNTEAMKYMRRVLHGLSATFYGPYDD